MKVYVVIEENEFKCSVIGVYTERNKALEKKMEAFSDRDIHECEVEN